MFKSRLVACLKSFKVHQHVLYVWDRIGYAPDSFVEFSKVRDEPYGAIFLGYHESGRSPLRSIDFL